MAFKGERFFIRVNLSKQNTNRRLEDLFKPREPLSRKFRQRNKRVPITKVPGTQDNFSGMKPGSIALADLKHVFIADE